MRTRNKINAPDAETNDMLMAALAEAEAELRNWRQRAETAEGDREVCQRGKEAWMAECNLLHARLDEINKLAAKELTADAG